jgi:hypothetical protein
VETPASQPLDEAASAPGSEWLGIDFHTTLVVLRGISMSGVLKATSNVAYLLQLTGDDRDTLIEVIWQVDDTSRCDISL